jgi:hypothetical protein
MLSKKFNFEVQDGLWVKGSQRQVEKIQSLVEKADLKEAQLFDDDDLNSRERGRLRKANGQYLVRAASVFKKLEFHDEKGHSVKNPGFFKPEGGVSDLAKSIAYNAKNKNGPSM